MSLFSECSPAHTGRVTYIRQTVIFQKLRFARHNRQVFHAAYLRNHILTIISFIFPLQVRWQYPVYSFQKISASAGYTETFVFSLEQMHEVSPISRSQLFRVKICLMRHELYVYDNVVIREMWDNITLIPLMCLYCVPTKNGSAVIQFEICGIICIMLIAKPQKCGTFQYLYLK